MGSQRWVCVILQPSKPPLQHKALGILQPSGYLPTTHIPNLTSDYTTLPFAETSTVSTPKTQATLAGTSTTATYS